MIRTALRLATIAALINGGKAPYPTIAGRHFYDSRQDDITDVAPRERRPVGVVRTDTDTTDHTRAGQVQDRAIARHIELRIEISVVTIGEDDGNLLVGVFETDDEIEALLDLFEWQIRVALFGHGPWALWWRGFWSPSEVVSQPIFAETDTGNIRLAARELAIRLVTHGGDCLPKPVKEGEQPAPVSLPAPLTHVFDRIARDGGGSLALAAAALRAKLEAQNLPQGAVHPLLAGVRLFVPEAIPPSGEDAATAIEAELHADIA